QRSVRASRGRRRRQYVSWDSSQKNQEVKDTRRLRFAPTYGRETTSGDRILLLTRWREVIGAERRGRQTRLVPQVDDPVVGPAVAHRHRLGHLVTPDDDLVVLDFRLGVVEFPVFTGDGEALELLALGDQAAAEVLETEEGLVAVHGHLVVDRAGILDLLVVG